ncbi:MAG: hypothetical protein F6K16_36845, partial [Symploca sp. SIO2B6]|nr:hypothetical protein [Symploca sp. SIO2B6]
MLISILDTLDRYAQIRGNLPVVTMAAMEPGKQCLQSNISASECFDLGHVTWSPKTIDKVLNIICSLSQSFQDFEQRFTVATPLVARAMGDGKQGGRSPSSQS